MHCKSTNLSRTNNNRIWGSGALSGKMMLVRIVENNKMKLILEQVRLSKG